MVLDGQADVVLGRAWWKLAVRFTLDQHLLVRILNPDHPPLADGDDLGGDGEDGTFLEWGEVAIQDGIQISILLCYAMCPDAVIEVTVAGSAPGR